MLGLGPCNLHPEHCFLRAFINFLRGVIFLLFKYIHIYIYTHTATYTYMYIYTHTHKEIFKIVAKHT